MAVGFMPLHANRKNARARAALAHAERGGRCRGMASAVQTTAVPSTSLINQLKGQPCIGGTPPLVVNQLKAGLTVTALTKASEHP